MEEQREKKPTQYEHEENPPLPYINRRRFLLGSSAIFYQAALHNKKNKKTIKETQNNLILLGDRSKFENLTELIKVNYQTEIQVKQRKS
jgi:hypothetical protein